jgi:protein-tyrosine kinase
MSRVDEARRRAVGLGGDVHPEGRDVPAAPADNAILEAYPRERRSGINRPTVPVRPVPKPVAAPQPVSLQQPGPLDPGEPKLVGRDISHVAAEQYRRLAGSLHQQQTETGLKTLMVTSSMPREGKTLTVTNLALTLSQSYKRRVLLIDADLRRPSVHEVLRLPNSAGLSECLRSPKGRPALVEVSPLLSVLTAGKLDADPMAGLTSERMGSLLEEWSAEFDWILLDAPPVGLMPDANLLARLTRAVVFVIAAGTTSHKVIERAIGQIGREFIIGTVLNRIDDQQLPVGAQYRDYYLTAK